MQPIRLAIVGMGKIARDQHLPAIADNPDFDLVATVSPNNAGTGDVPHYRSLDALFDAVSDIDAVSLCTTPQVRYDLAAAALRKDVHVFLEKPPGATLSEVGALERIAEAHNRTLFASWHSRYAAGVEPARIWLSDRRIERVEIVWREDVRHWHPGQAWIWEPGGLGVFDPGINALSIATRILPNPIFLRAAILETPANRAAPIAARLTMADTLGAPIEMDLDWRQTGPQTWTIAVHTDAGTCTLSLGGSVLDLPGERQARDDTEYAALYRRFASLIDEGASDVDTDPLRLVADAFLRGHRIACEPFDD